MIGGKDSKRAWLIIGAVLVFVIAENFYTFLPDINTSKAYYWSRSLSFVVISYVLYLISTRPKTKVAAFFLLCLAVSDLLDELLFNPEAISYFEYVSFIVISTLTILKWRKIGKYR